MTSTIVVVGTTIGALALSPMGSAQAAGRPEILSLTPVVARHQTTTFQVDAKRAHARVVLSRIEDKRWVRTAVRRSDADGFFHWSMRNPVDHEECTRYRITVAGRTSRTTEVCTQRQIAWLYPTTQDMYGPTTTSARIGKQVTMKVYELVDHPDRAFTFQVQRGDRWRVLDRRRISEFGDTLVRFTPRREGTFRFRVVFARWHGASRSVTNVHELVVDR